MSPSTVLAVISAPRRYWKTVITVPTTASTRASFSRAVDGSATWKQDPRPPSAMSGPDGAFSDGAFRVVPIIVPRLVRPLRDAYVAIGRALEPLDVADTDVAVAGGSRLRALL